VPDGVLTVTVPPGARAGTKLRLRGKGLWRAPGEGGGRGDFHAVLRLALPENLNARQRKLIEELGLAGPSEVRGGARVPPVG
jgi:DnaJ-class molecular chaperone